MTYGPDTGAQQLAIEGKTPRRSNHGEKTTTLHLLSAMAAVSGLVVDQTAGQF